MNSRIKDFYRELDLEPGADLTLIRQTYRQLVKVWHPDRFANDEKLQTLANEKLKKIILAYESLAAFIENGENNEPPPPAKAKAHPTNTEDSLDDAIYGAGLGAYKRACTGIIWWFFIGWDRGLIHPGGRRYPS